jgi:hypothetical protein
MINVTFNSASTWLIDDWPDWGKGVTVEAAIPASYERGLTGKETRRQTGDTPRLGIKFTSLLTSPQAITNLRNALQQYGQNGVGSSMPTMQVVLCPLWPGRFSPGQTPPASSPFYVLFNEDNSFNSIVPSSTLNSRSSSLIAYPLLVGILPTVPDLDLLTSVVATFSVAFQENDSTNLLTPPAYNPPNGIAAASGVRPLFPFAANWVTSPKSGTAEFDIDRRQIGEVRALSQIFYTQRNRRRIQQDLLLQNEDPLNLLAFFVQMGGETQSFWLPANLREANLTANVAATDEVLNIDNPSALGTNTFICLNDGNNRVPLVVSGVSGNQWQLSAAVGQTFSAATTNLESLVLARFDALKLTINFITATAAKVSLKFKELPWETAAVAGETIGATMGPLPTTAMLYTLTLTTPGSATAWRYTNFERDLYDSSNNHYYSAPIENDEITDAPNLERQSVKVKSRNFIINAQPNPFSLLIPFQLEFPLEITIAEGNVGTTVSGETQVAIINTYFSGEVGDVSMDGPILEATCMSLNWMFDRTAARRLYQNNDNWNLFEPASGLSASDWQWNAQVVSYNASTATLTIGTISANNQTLNGGTTLAAHYFAAGYVQITHGGVTQYRMVSDSTAIAAGQIVISLASPLSTSIAIAAGDTVQIFAGYDGQYETAISKFNNGPNFGGFPFIPVGNPFVLKVTQNPGGGKK